MADIASILEAIPVPSQDSNEVWGSRIAGGTLVVGKSFKKLYLIGPAARGRGRMHVEDCSLEPDVSFQWMEDGEGHTENVSSFSLVRDLGTTIDAFAQAVQSLVGFLGTEPDGDALVDILEAWLVVLSSSHGPTQQELVGFWGELLAIKHSGAPTKAVSAWQWRDAAPIDFSMGTLQVEVKTSSTGNRQHTIPLGQLRDGVRAGGRILSISTTWSPAGLPLARLIREVTDAVRDDKDAVKTVGAAVARRVGLVVARDECLLDEESAVHSMRLIDFGQLASALTVPGLVEGRLVFDLAELSADPVAASLGWLDVDSS